MQEATEKLRKSTLTVSDVKLGSTVKSMVSLMERMTASLRFGLARLNDCMHVYNESYNYSVIISLLVSIHRSSSLSELTGHIESIQTEIVSVLEVTRRFAKECSIQSISDNIESGVSKMDTLSHQLCHVARVRLHYCQGES